MKLSNSYTEDRTIRQSAQCISGNILFATLFIVILFCFLGTQALLATNFEFPKWMGVDTSYSSLEGRPYQKMPSLTLNSIRSNEFQEQTESWTSDQFPMRDKLLLTNAALQRFGIRSANLIAHYDSYPTFYGSDYSVTPSLNMISRNVFKQPTNTNNLDTMLEYINSISEEFPKLKIVYEQLDNIYSTKFNPTYHLTTGNYNSGRIAGYIQEHLPDNVNFIWEPINSETELMQDWFRTEHHPTIQRALRSYKSIGSILEWQQIKDESIIEICPEWFGVNNRMGRDLDYSDSLQNASNQFPNLTWYKWNDGRDLKITPENEESLLEDSPIFDLYNKYFRAATMEAINNNAGNDKTCLVISQSYIKPIKTFIADNYKRAIFIEASAFASQRSIKDYILHEGIDDLIIQTGPNGWDSIMEKSPALFEQSHSAPPRADLAKPIL